MILDSSAVVAVFLREPSHEIILEKLTTASQLGIGAPTLVETALVLSARIGEDARARLARFREEAAVSIVPFTDVHYSVAVDAWLKYGKGRHPAHLNFGDCLAYATAKLAGQPLLCRGQDFTKTDLDLA